MKRFFICCTGIFFFLVAHSQDFSYTVSADSVGWNELSSQTILNANNSAWSFSYKIPVGFTFNYLGRNFDSLMIETNGYLVFDHDRNYAFTAYNGFGDRIDSVGNHAVIGYELSGSTGNHILKIQYKNAGQSLSDSRSQSWQIWLKESGNLVELHAGPTNYRCVPMEVMVTDSIVTTDSLNEQIVTYYDSTYTTDMLDSSQSCRIGLLNQNMDTENRGLFLSGDPAAPSGAPVNENNPETAVLNFIPAAGYRYTFTPIAN